MIKLRWILKRVCKYLQEPKKHASQMFCSSKGEVKFDKADNATWTTCLVQYRQGLTIGQGGPTERSFIWD